MNNSDNYSDCEFVGLLLLALDGEVNEEQFAFLQKQIVSNNDAQKLYYDFLATYVGLSHYGKFASSSLNRPEPESEYDILLALLADDEKIAPAVHIDKSDKSEFVPIEKIKVAKQKRRVSRLSVYTLILSAAAMLFLMILVLSSPIRPIVATLTDSINAEWISEDKIPAKWDVLRQGELALAKGLAEITFNNGAVVVVEGPAIIELENSKSMFLTSGKISAVVSQYATGFTVNTRSASIVDLGTEFGVSVEGDGSCSLHMFKGEAILIAGREDQKKTSQTINANEARNVDCATGKVQDIVLGKKSFVRHIDSNKGFVWRGGDLDLADIVGGGNGFGTGSTGYGINPQTGKYVTNNRPGPKKRTKAFQSVSNSTFIDGVFIPDSNVKETVFNSNGDTFTGLSYAAATCSADICSKPDVIYYDHGTESCLPYLNGKCFGTAESPYIYMHSNAGITFSLDSIRAFVPTQAIMGFTAQCGIPERLNQDPELELFVLIDGKIQYQELLTKQKGIIPIEFEVEDSDKYLTFVVTEGSDTSQFDLLIIAEPKLQIE